MQPWPTITNHPKITLKRRASARICAACSAGAGSAFVTSCGGGSGSSGTSITATASAATTSSSSSSSTSSTSSASASTGCTEAATNTNGPFPADGSNTINGSVVNVLSQSGIVRSNITSSFGSYSGTAAGVPLKLTITVESGCAPAAGYAVYIWHCDENGLYSLYNTTDQNYLRGVQVSDANGQVTFTTIFPACYSGRMPHIHVEVYASLATATVETNALKVTQLTFPLATMQSVYNNVSAYSASVANLAAISFASDMVFAGDTSAQLTAATVTMSGDYSSGFTGTVTVEV